MAELKLYDVTMRDGGLVNDFRFEDSFVRRLYETNCQAGIDYMEIGYRADKKLFAPADFGPWKFSSDDDIRRVIGEKGSTRICIMTDVRRTDLNDIHPAAESPVDLIRVATYIDTLPEAMRLMEHASQMGYETTCNIMAISRATDEQIREALRQLATSPATSVFIVDSYGALLPTQTRHITEIYREALAGTGKQVGIHCHNNLQCAFANTLEAIHSGATMADATLYGMGRGAGNCHMEQLGGYLSGQSTTAGAYKIEPLLRMVETDMLALKARGPEWGYNTSFMLTGLTNQHPRVAIQATRGEEHDFVAQYRNESV